MSHQIEPELQSAPPRPITRRAGHGHFINFMHIFLAPHALVGIGLVFMLLFGIAHSFFGTQVEALVLGKSESSTKKGPSYSLRYEYQLPGKRIFAEESVSWRLYAKLHQGAVVKVKALAIGPFSTENLLEAEPKIPILFIFLFMLLWNGCLLGGFIWPLVIVPLLQRSLVREGRPFRMITTSLCDGESAPGMVLGTWLWPVIPSWDGAEATALWPETAAPRASAS